MEEKVNQGQQEKCDKVFDNDIVISKAVEQLTKDSHCLDIGQQNLISIPESLYTHCTELKFLYLEGNSLEELPPSLFPSLPHLRWLDVRNNRLRELPATVAHHRCLEVLLLQGNQLRELPLELGLVPRLRGLQLTGNPLQMPPGDVVSSGVQAVLSYLRHQWTLCTRSPLSIKPVERLVYKESKKGRVSGRTGRPKSCWSATAQGRHPVEARRLKAKSADVPVMSVRGYRCGRELVAPGTTPALTCGQQTPDTKTDRRFKHVKKFRSLEEKIFHLWPSTSDELINSDEMACKIQENYLKEVCVYKLKEMLGRQASVLQRRSDAAVLKLWRKDAKHAKKLCTKKSVVPPYDTDPSYLCMLSRAEARDPKARLTSNITTSHRTGRSVNQELEDVACKLHEPSAATGDMAPQPRQQAMQAEIHKLTELQRKLQALKLRNNRADRPGNIATKL